MLGHRVALFSLTCINLFFVLPTPPAIAIDRTIDPDETITDSDDSGDSVLNPSARVRSGAPARVPGSQAAGPGSSSFPEGVAPPADDEEYYRLRQELAKRPPEAPVATVPEDGSFSPAPPAVPLEHAQQVSAPPDSSEKDEPSDEITSRDLPVLGRTMERKPGTISSNPREREAAAMENRLSAALGSGDPAEIRSALEGWLPLVGRGSPASGDKNASSIEIRFSPGGKVELVSPKDPPSLPGIETGSEGVSPGVKFSGAPSQSGPTSTSSDSSIVLTEKQEAVGINAKPIVEPSRPRTLPKGLVLSLLQAMNEKKRGLVPKRDFEPSVPGKALAKASKVPSKAPATKVLASFPLISSGWGSIGPISAPLTKGFLFGGLLGIFLIWRRSRRKQVRRTR